MQYLKKYLTEGLIQVAILLSLCGVRVDVGLEPYLTNSWPERILGPTSALTQTQFHNLRNRLEGGTGLHPKSVDLEGFFTTRRLLGWVRSLDRLQVPQAELETWLVQQDPSPLPVRLLQQPSPVERAPDILILPVEPRDERDDLREEQEDHDRQVGTHHVLHHSGRLDEEGEEDGDDEDQFMLQRHHLRREGRGGHEVYYETDNREMNQNEADQSSLSLQECLTLLEETFPFSEEQQVQARNAGGRTGDMQRLPADAEPLLSPVPTDGSPLDMELEWQDLLAIMEPQSSDVDMMTLLDQNSDLNPSGTILQPNTLHQNYHSPETEQEVPLLDGYLHHSLLEPSGHSENQESAFLPLVPSDQLADHSLNREDTLKPFHVSDSHNPPCTMNLFEEDAPGNLCMGPTADPNRFNLLPEDLVDNAQSYDPSFLLDEEDIEDINGPLSDILEDAAMLEEMDLLDLALEEGFSPEMTARLEEEGYLDPELTHRTSQLSLNMEERDSGHSESNTRLGEDTTQTVSQDGEDEAESDSGLSLDSSHSPTSPCVSEASSYSSSSSTASSVFSEDDANEGPCMELEVTIKQEPEEEELGAVGGEYCVDDVKKLYPPVYEDHKPFNGFPWLEQISHDHTYNQQRSSASSLSPKIPTKHSKSSHRHNKPYRFSSSKHFWGRDERRARALKIPFSNDLIVNLPVEEFNDLLANYNLDEEQLSLVRDIRRRGKNKIAAQNCRKRKMDVLVGLERDVSVLKRHRSRLFREKQEALRTLQDLRQRLSNLYQDVFSRLRDEEGRALDVNEYLLSFGPNGSVSVTSRTPKKGVKSGKKQKDKKK